MRLDFVQDFAAVAAGHQIFHQNYIDSLMREYFKRIADGSSGLHLEIRSGEYSAVALEHGFVIVDDEDYRFGIHHWRSPRGFSSLTDELSWIEHGGAFCKKWPQRQVFRYHFVGKPILYKGIESIYRRRSRFSNEFTSDLLKALEQ
jgi:hypothetical protein